MPSEPASGSDGRPVTRGYASFRYLGVKAPFGRPAFGSRRFSDSLTADRR